MPIRRSQKSNGRSNLRLDDAHRGGYASPWAPPRKGNGVRAALLLLVAGFLFGQLAWAQKPEGQLPTATETQGQQSNERPEADEKNDETQIFVYENGGRRDPFRSLILSQDELDRREREEAAARQESEEEEEEETPPEFLPPLERFDLSNLDLVGIIRTKKGNLAVVQAPDGHGYFLRKKTRLGRNKGAVVQIEADFIVIEEQHKNPLGRYERKEVVVKLRPDEG